MPPQPDGHPQGGQSSNTPDATTHVLCPHCPKRRKFKHVYAAQDHFLHKHHQTCCPICNVDFGHAIPLIIHFQSHSECYGQSSSISRNYNSTAITQASQVSRTSQLPVQEFLIQDTRLALVTSSTASVTSQVSQVNKNSQLNQLNQVKKVAQASQTTHAVNVSPQQLPRQYTQLAPEEHDYVLQELVSRCHPASRLRRQDYKIFTLTGPVVRDKRLPGHDTSGNESVRTGNFTKVLKSGGQTDRKDGPPKEPKKAHALPLELFKYTPQRQPAGGPGKRKAVALDCEMVGTNTRHSELAYLSAVDFLTGEVLIDSFVYPTGTVVSWRTKKSGINRANMNKAWTSGKALNGWHAARDKLWEFIDDHTVLVGHALQNDLQVLGIVHSAIVDSSLVTAGAVFNTLESDKRFPRVWALRKLATALLNRDIQNSNKGHSALEDAYAARDLVLCAIRTPSVLAEWALVARKIEERKQEERERRMEEAKKRKAEALRKKNLSSLQLRPKSR